MTYREKMIHALKTVPVHDGVIRMSEEVRDKIVELLKEQPEQKHEQEVVLRCKDCGYWIPGTIDEHDNFIPPRCKINNGPWSASEHCSRAIRR